MAKGSYQIVFSGKTFEHADLDMVKNNLGNVFSLSAERIEKLFSGQRLVLKKDIDQATAERYKATLQRAGALCEIEDLAALEETKHEIIQVTQAKAQIDDTEMSVAEPGSQIGAHHEPVAADIDISAFDMAEPGITLAEPEYVAEANIDTGEMNMFDVGVALAEPPIFTEAHIDTSNLDMADAGASLVEAEEFLKVEFDLAQLSMDEAGVTLAEPKPVPDANIDTSQLSLD